ncbi:MAG: hypothetical protein HPY61_07470 [Methanotrichaceae archaeon]|nr:hypothetical protein [Methanotrichaceae archaeon]
MVHLEEAANPPDKRPLRWISRTSESIEYLQKDSEEEAWQGFERLVASSSRDDSWAQVGKVKTSKRRRRQYDVVAEKGNGTFLVECKRSGLKTATGYRH